MIYEDIEVESTHDGDTTTLKINVFIHRMFYIGACRLLGINTPELNSTDPATAEKAEVAHKRLSYLLTKKPLKVECRADDKYGRPLVTLWYLKPKTKTLPEAWICINQTMLDENLADPISLSAQRKQTKNLHIQVSPAKHLSAKTPGNKHYNFEQIHPYSFVMVEQPGIG
jgi:endonuclease YncB( thermonuclease family)